MFAVCAHEFSRHPSRNNQLQEPKKWICPVPLATKQPAETPKPLHLSTHHRATSDHQSEDPELESQPLPQDPATYVESVLRQVYQNK
jgi:hypothetical protein